MSVPRVVIPALVFTLPIEGTPHVDVVASTPQDRAALTAWLASDAEPVWALLDTVTDLLAAIDAVREGRDA